MVIDGQPFTLPWIVKDVHADLFAAKAKELGFSTSVFAEPDECIEMASAEAAIPPGCHGINVSGDNYSGASWIRLREIFDETVKEREKAFANKEKRE